jgi:hypothetical protein
MLIDSWDNFKILVSTKALLMQYMERADTYEIFAPEAQTFLWNISLLKGSSDVIDFETNYKSDCNKPLEYRSVDGLPKVANAMFTDALSYWVDGANGNLTIASGQTGYLKTHFSTSFKLNGVDIHWEGANFEDSITFEVGVYNNNDVSSEDNFIPLAQFAHQYRVLGNGTKTFEVATVKTVPSTYNGLDIYIRTFYVNSGGSAVNLCVNLLGYK